MRDLIHKTPEISWHGREPIYSVDYQPPVDNIKRIATGGADKFVRIWSVITTEKGESNVEFLSNLERHDRTINCVRFSPDGKILASASDDNTIILWKKNETIVPASANIFKEEEKENKENWNVFKCLRGHLSEVFDLSWSADGIYLLSGSVDCTSVLWEAKKGQRVGLFPEAKMKIQGVCLDPKYQMFVTLSEDRSCRVYKIATKSCMYNMNKLTLNAARGSSEASAGGEQEKPRSFRMFVDDTNSFFRRLSFTPDGELLIAPSGMLDTKGDNNNCKHCTYVFTRQSLPKPVLQLPSPDKPSLIVRCCPQLFALRDTPHENGKPSSLFRLPYRMVYAVATEDTIMIYDTQQLQPIALVAHIHYASISDMAWSPDGAILLVSSADGYCTIITIKEGKLGQPYQKDQLKVENSVDKDDAKTKSTSQTKPTTNKEKKTESTARTNRGPMGGSTSTQQRSATPAQTSVSASHSTAGESSDNQKKPRRIQVTTLTTDLLSNHQEQSKEPNTSVPTKPVSTGASSSSTSTPAPGSTSSTPVLNSSSSSAPKSTSTAAPNSSSTPVPDKKLTPQPRRVKVTTLTTYSSDTTTNSQPQPNDSNCDKQDKSAADQPKKTAKRRIQVTTLSTLSDTSKTATDETLKDQSEEATTLSEASQDSDSQNLCLQLETTCDATSDASVTSAAASMNSTTIKTSAGQTKPAEGKRRVQFTTLKKF